MFCSECGTTISEGAKFCYNCGAKIEYTWKKEEDNKNEIMSCNEINTLANTYVSTIKKTVMEKYLSEEEICSDMFYRKAKLYEMKPEDVDRVVEHELKVIEYMNRYCCELFEDGRRFFLSDEQIDEIIQYGKSLGLTDKVCVEFKDYYLIKNEMSTKQEFFSEVILKYSETGKVINDVPEKYRKLHTENPKILLDFFKSKIYEIEEELSSKYKENPTLSKEQKEYLESKLISKGISPDYIDYFIGGYEISSGIIEKRNKAKKERVLSNLESLSHQYTIFGVSITLESKFFLLAFLTYYLEEPVNVFYDEFDKIDKASNGAYYEINRLFQQYNTEMDQRIQQCSTLLEIDLSEGIFCEISKEMNCLGEEIERLEDQFKAIEQGLEDKKVLRKEIKDERGRWEGGGFGVGGALKGAATASVMNAATGLAYSGAGMIGSAVSNLSASHDRRKIIEEFENSFIILFHLTTDIIDYFKTEISSNYPEIFFNPFVKDTQKEKELRNIIIEGGIREKIKATSQLLRINPASWRNGLCISLRMRKYPQYWDKSTDEALDDLERTFSWVDNFHDECEKLGTLVGESYQKLKEGKIIDKQEYDRIKELYIFMNMCKDPVKDQKNSGHEMDKLLDVLEKMFDEYEKVSRYTQEYELISSMPIEIAFNTANQYCAKKEFDKAKKLFVKAVNGDKIFSGILEEIFAENVNREAVMAYLEKFISKEGNMDVEIFQRAMYTIVHLKDRQGKALLVYAAETNQDTILQTLIRNGADVNELYQLLRKKTEKQNKDEKDSNDDVYIICVACGKKIKHNVKFCNFCGKKQLVEEKNK